MTTRDRQYPRLRPRDREALQLIEPSVYGKVKYFPCDVTLVDGTLCERVYLTAARPYYSLWGIWPEDDSHKRHVDLNDIRSIVESRHRIPARFANRIYAAGESGMGYFLFTIVFTDGASLTIVNGGAIDFIAYPPGKTADDIEEIFPDQERVATPVEGPPYAWCLYEE